MVLQQNIFALMNVFYCGCLDMSEGQGFVYKIKKELAVKCYIVAVDTHGFMPNERVV